MYGSMRSATVSSSRIFTSMPNISMYQFHDFLKSTVPVPICWIPEIINDSIYKRFRFSIRLYSKSVYYCGAKVENYSDIPRINQIGCVLLSVMCFRIIFVSLRSEQ